MLVVCFALGGCQDGSNRDGGGGPSQRALQLSNYLLDGSLQGQHYEFDLGEYRVPVPQHDLNTVLFVEFQLIAVVPQSEEERLKARVKLVEHRLRHAVIVAVRKLSRSEIFQQELTVVKARLIEAINRVLGKPTVKKIEFFRFSYLEE